MIGEHGWGACSGLVVVRVCALGVSFVGCSVECFSNTVLHCILKLSLWSWLAEVFASTPVHVIFLIKDVGSVLLRFINGCVCRGAVKLS